MKIMRIRKHAAQVALKFFKEIAPIKSSTSANPKVRGTEMDWEIIKAYRNNGPVSIMSSIKNALNTGLGNCGEKTAICYASLSCNPTLLTNSFVTILYVINTDHQFIAITDHADPGTSTVFLPKLGQTALIIDPLSEDWYFPNLDTFTATTNFLVNFPDKWQRKERNKIAHGELIEGYLPMDISLENPPP